MATLAGSLPSGLTLASPLERRWLPVPAMRRRLQPLHDLLGCRGMLPVQCSAFQDALHRFRHVQVQPAQRRKEGHDPVVEEPEDEVDGVVPGQVVPDQQQPERRELMGQGDAAGESLLPACPATSILLGWEELWLGQARQDRGQLGFQPGMKDGVGRAPHSLHMHLTTGWMEEGQLLGGSLTGILMGIADRLPCRVPVGAGIGNRLIGASLVFGVYRQHILGIRRLNQVFFATASGSTTVTVPLFRLRTAVPISHQLRSLLQVNPASCRMHQMV